MRPAPQPTPSMKDFFEDLLVLFILAAIIMWGVVL
jgi:hypothetical protein